MLDILFISKRNGHGRYFTKLAENSVLNAKVHLLGQINIFALTSLLKVLNIELIKTVEKQITRDQAKYPKLLANNWLTHCYRQILFVKERIRLAYFVDLLTRLTPKKVGIWNGDKLPNETVVIAAKLLNIEVVYFENGLLPNTATVDFNGVNAKNSLPRTSTFYLNYRESKHLQPPSELLVRAPHKKRTHTDSRKSLPRKYIFVPFQVPNDTQIVVNSPWVKSMESFFDIVTKVHQQSIWHNTQLVFKEHPSWPKCYVQSCKANNASFYNELTTQDLIDNAEFVVTINSTVGIESLLRTKRVITLGEACYNINNLVLNATCGKELLNAFNEMKEWQFNETLRRKFISFVYEQYCIPTRWSQADEQHIAAVDKRLQKRDSFFEWLNSQAA